MITLLNSRRDRIQQQLDAIDLGAMHLAVKDAESSLKEFELTNTNRPPLSPVEREMSRLRGAVAHAKQDLQSAEGDVQRLTRDLAHLDSMLGADALIDATENAIQPARAVAAEAQTGLDSALGVQREIESLLAVEQSAHEQQNVQAANDLLASVRNGTKPAPFRSNRGMLDALVHAHDQAVADVVHAQATLGAAQAALDAILHARLEAQTNATERDLYMVARSYAIALVTHETACDACRVHFATPDIDALVGDIKRDGEAVGVPGDMPGTPWGAEAR